MLRRDFPELYMYAKRKGFMVCVFTNAYTLNGTLFNLFEQYPPFSVDIYKTRRRTLNSLRKMLDELEGTK